MLPPLELLISLMLVAALSTTEVSSEVGFQTGLCGRSEGDGGEDSCTELEEGETCRTRASRHEEGSTTACVEPTAAGSVDGIVSSSCVDFSTGENCLQSNLGVGCEEDCGSSASVQLPEEAMWPRLSYTARGVNSTHYLVDISWTPPIGVSVPGYVLVIIGDSSIADWDRCGIYNGGQCLHCVVQLDNTTFHYRHESTYLTYKFGVIHIKGKLGSSNVTLIPSNWCDGPSVRVNPPESCHHACPGNCKLCGTLDIDIAKPPRNVNYSICHNHRNSTYSGTFWWESGITGYERPNPMAIFYFYLTTIDGNHGSDGRISNRIRTQHRPVTLHNLTLEEDTTYYIRIRQYECECADFKSFPFVISSSVSACDGGNSPASANRSATSTISVISSTPNLRTSSTVATSTPIPSSDPTQTTVNAIPNQMSGQTVIIAAAISVGVALLLLVVVLMAVVTLRHLQSADKLPYSSPTKRAQVSPKVQNTQKLLVLYSWGTSEHNQQCIMQSVTSLLVYDTVLVYSAKSEVRGNIPQWVEKHVSDSDKVLIVCNEQFSSEWQSPGSTHTEGAIVNALKAIITGHINSGTMDKICSKTALVFLKEKHKELVPSGILHSFKQYMLCEENSDKQNELLRFISDTPLFNFCPQDEDLKVIV